LIHNLVVSIENRKAATARRLPDPECTVYGPGEEAVALEQSRANDHEIMASEERQLLPARPFPCPHGPVEKMYSYQASVGQSCGTCDRGGVLAGPSEYFSCAGIHEDQFTGHVPGNDPPVVQYLRTFQMRASGDGEPLERIAIPHIDPVEVQGQHP